eukprot:TRINITY_DN124393_c0_g1_i1.p1 TRINITY_DN124393_c0_g1~~TRINITY_DN124393_c0_g1_i1.p1  ORF type:complete len:317 (+),score=92.48 TRINITY_DN124393_c0_g1_i1:74-1024(+)
MSLSWRCRRGTAAFVPLAALLSLPLTESVRVDDDIAGEASGGPSSGSTSAAAEAQYLQDVRGAVRSLEDGDPQLARQQERQAERLRENADASLRAATDSGLLQVGSRSKSGAKAATVAAKLRQVEKEVSASRQLEAEASQLLGGTKNAMDTHTSPQDQACRCMQEWRYAQDGKKYPGCAETPDWAGHHWCYVEGGTLCKSAKDSEVATESRKFRECEDPPSTPTSGKLAQQTTEDEESEKVAEAKSAQAVYRAAEARVLMARQALQQAQGEVTVLQRHEGSVERKADKAASEEMKQIAERRKQVEASMAAAGAELN